MPTNPVLFQASTILNSLIHQATGQSNIVASTPGEFVSVAQTALKNGYDPIINTMNQMWSRTIFSTRPYQRKLAILEKDMPKFGNMIRKISVADQDLVDDERYKYPVAYDATQTDNPKGNGLSVDMFKIRKPELLQTNFYGQSVYENWMSLFKEQWDVALSGPEEFMRLQSLYTGNRSDKLEQTREEIARGLLANAIGSLLDEGQNARVVHLLTEYNTLTGLELTAQSVYQPENYPAFIRWMYSRMSNIARFMSDRSQMYQTVINNKPVMRHTPSDRLNAFLYAPAMDMINSMALPVTFHDDSLKMVKWEGVSYWQSIETPDSISVTPTYTDNTGAAKTGAAKEQAGIFGLLCDEEFLGYAMTESYSLATPVVANGVYWNIYDHANFKTIMDMTEKAVVLLLD